MARLAIPLTRRPCPRYATHWADRNGNSVIPVYYPNPPPVGDYKIVIEVMGLPLEKTFTFK